MAMRYNFTVYSVATWRNTR